MTEPYLTLAEMKQCYPNEWVLLDRPELDRHHQVRGGLILFHTPDRAEMDRRLLNLRDDECVPFVACIYTGEQVTDVADLEGGVDARRAAR